jgi:hypothetical protein
MAVAPLIYLVSSNGAVLKPKWPWKWPYMVLRSERPRFRPRTKFALKGQCQEIFDLRVFSSNNTPWAPDSRAKAFLNFSSNSPRYDRFSNAKIVHAVSMTPHARKFVVRYRYPL